ncbi:MAG: hypothetical protein CVV44_13920 [Spirochaetae bacterium HGW-Spirochaetae-1]|nr:MAG: hypothetical protein CVV44_13920 [Spirochaetae bacterium HGW-Spirochaetae-1]
MKNKLSLTLPIFIIALFAGSLFMISMLQAQGGDIGYRKLMLGQSKDQIRQVIKSNFGSEYTSTDEGDNAIILRKMQAAKPVILIELLFDRNDVLYKINVKIRKIPGNPVPDDVIKVIEDKYGKPVKRDITSGLDMVLRWNIKDGRYDIFFQSISSWDKFDVQYTDTSLQKRKEDYDKEMKRKPVSRDLEF